MPHGRHSCFGEAAVASDAIAEVDATVATRVAAQVARAGDVSGTRSSDGRSYTRRLLVDRNLRLKKLGEEAAELVVACADGTQDRVAAEAADLVYHMIVALRAAGTNWSAVRAVLADRAHPGEVTV